MTDQQPAVVVVQRMLRASPDDIYGEWLDAEGMVEWMCPRPAHPTKIELESWVGGRLLIDIDDEGSALSVTGQFLELDEPRRLRFTWRCSVWDPPADSIVTVSLEPQGDGHTMMTIHHELLPPAVVDGHRHGWALIAEQLEDSLSDHSRK